MAFRLLEVDQIGFPLDAGSTIHKQEGSPDLIAVGPGELEKLPKAQQKAVNTLLSTGSLEGGLAGFLSSEDGTLFLSDCSPVVASITPKGQTETFVEWLG